MENRTDGRITITLTVDRKTLVDCVANSTMELSLKYGVENGMSLMMVGAMMTDDRIVGINSIDVDRNPDKDLVSALLATVLTFKEEEIRAMSAEEIERYVKNTRK